MRRIVKKAEETIEKFLQMEAAGGICLMIAAGLALIMANSPLAPLYDSLLHTNVWPQEDHAGGHGFSIVLFINDALMAVFFFLVGLEIKREFVDGELSSRERALLPALAALGGMIVPAVFYVLVNVAYPDNWAGWAIPSATDIAFSLGVLALLGSRIPLSLKILLTAIAVMDDLGAIAVIALFYSGHIQWFALVSAAGILAVLFLLSRREETSIPLYLCLGVALWFAVLQSGIHATLAGVATALFIPVRSREPDAESPALRIEHALHPWVAYGILPLFAFANAGVSFSGLGLGALGDPVTLGILAGLVAGKQAGIFGAIWLAVRAGVCQLPQDLNWRHIYGMAILCGIGFTMSLFIGGLAFADPAHQVSIRVGVLIASFISALAGFLYLRKVLGEAEEAKTNQGSGI